MRSHMRLLATGHTHALYSLRRRHVKESQYTYSCIEALIVHGCNTIIVKVVTKTKEHVNATHIRCHLAHASCGDYLSRAL